MQDEIVSVEVENGAVSAVVLPPSAHEGPVKAAVIASGTFSADGDHRRVHRES